MPAATVKEHFMSQDHGSAGRILVGPAGWSYKDWEGQVYPKPKPRGFDHLAYLAQYFDTIEINSTFYRIPEAKSTQQWVDQVSDHQAFRFTAKLWQGFTHEGTASAQDEAAFRRAMDPLQRAGRLGAVLLQFPYRFHDTPDNRQRVRYLAEAFRAYPLVLEVRYRSWDRPEIYEFLRDLGMGFCNIDQPQVPYSIGLTDHVTSAVGYLRLHGRNAAPWFAERGDAAERYNYRYAREELEPSRRLRRPSAGRRGRPTSSPTTTSGGRRRSTPWNYEHVCAAPECRCRRCCSAPTQSLAQLRRPHQRRSMSGLPPGVRRIPDQIPRRRWLHNLDRPASLARLEPQSHVHDLQEVTGEGTARWTIGRHGLRHEKPWPLRWDLRQRVEHPPKQQRRLLACDSLIKEMGQRIQEDHEPYGVRGEQGSQALTAERGELPAGERPHQMCPPQEHLWRDAAGPGHGDQWVELEDPVSVDDRHMEPVGQHSGGGVEGHAMHLRITPQEHRSGLGWDGQRRAHGKYMSP
jgi:uncharacterized protein YecE (DUF72 family)